MDQVFIYDNKSLMFSSSGQVLFFSLEKDDFGKAYFWKQYDSI